MHFQSFLGRTAERAERYVLADEPATKGDEPLRTWEGHPPTAGEVEAICDSERPGRWRLYAYDAEGKRCGSKQLTLEERQVGSPPDIEPPSHGVMVGTLVAHMISQARWTTETMANLALQRSREADAARREADRLRGKLAEAEREAAEATDEPLSDKVIELLDSEEVRPIVAGMIANLANKFGSQAN